MMRRTGPPQRRKRLEAKTDLRRTAMAPRKSRMKTMSGRRVQEQEVRRQMADEIQGHRCMIGLDRVCTGRAEHWHELVASAHRGSRVDRRNLVPSCDACNGHLETLPDRYDRGLKVKSWDAKPGVDGLIPAVPSRWAIATAEEGWL